MERERRGEEMIGGRGEEGRKRKEEDEERKIDWEDRSE